MSKRIDKHFAIARREAIRDMEAWSQRYASAEGITITQALKQANASDIQSLIDRNKDLIMNYGKRKGFERHADRMQAYATNMSRLETLTRWIEADMTEAYVRSADEIANRLMNVGEQELIRQARELDMTLPPKEVLRHNAETLANASYQNTTWSNRIWSDQEELRKEIEEGITRSLMLGKHPTAWMRSMESLINDIEDSKSYVMRRIAVTESARVQIEAQRTSYERSGYRKYIVIIEESACDYCKTHDEYIGEVSSIEIGVNVPPFHPNCRCSTSAYMDPLETQSEFERLKSMM